MGRIKTGMLVGAAVRLASAELIDCVVVNRGDADAGASDAAPREVNGPKGPEPTRYGDWEQKGRCSDF